MRYSLQPEHKTKQGPQGEPRVSESRMKTCDFKGMECQRASIGTMGTGLCLLCMLPGTVCDHGGFYRKRNSRNSTKLNRYSTQWNTKQAQQFTPLGYDSMLDQTTKFELKSRQFIMPMKKKLSNHDHDFILQSFTQCWALSVIR